MAVVWDENKGLVEVLALISRDCGVQSARTGRSIEADPPCSLACPRWSPIPLCTCPSMIQVRGA